MKSWLTLFLIVFSLFISFGQSCLPNGITFSTQADIDAFANDYPDCEEILGNVSIDLANSADPISSFAGIQGITTINGNLNIINLNGGLGGLKTDLTGLENLTKIGGNFVVSMSFNNNFESFHGLQGLTSIGGQLQLIDSVIDDFSGLENLKSVGSLDIGMCFLNNFQGLASLDSIHGDFRIFYSNFNDFSGLHSLKTIEGTLDLHSNSFDNFQGLQSLEYIGNFHSSDDVFQSFEGLNNVATIEGGIDLSQSTMQNFEGLDQLGQINGITIWGCPELIDFEGLDHLKMITNRLDISGCPQLTSFKGLEQVASIEGVLTVFDNQALVNINGLDNADFSNLDLLQLFGNQSLSFCSSLLVCNYLGMSGAIDIAANAPGCLSTDEVIALCGDNLSKIRYFTYYDLNQNQSFDPDEPFYSDASIAIDPLSTLHFDNSGNGGTLYLEPGDYTLSLGDNDSWSLTTSTNNFPISITAPNSCDSIYFGLSPIVETAQLATTIQSPPTRCNEFIDFEVCTKNIGTTTESGILWIDIDPEILAVDLIDQVDTVEAPYSYGWHFSNLYPSQSISRSIRLQIPGPPDFPLGDLLNFFAYVDFEEQSWIQNATGFRYQPEVRCSYDPNDKLVNPNRDGNYTLFEESLVYTVRFQNTGNDYARDVVIRDTLDPNLDASTFQILGTSHPNQLSTRLLEDQYLTFDFSNIFLPDSTADFEGSQGYVSYLIKGEEGLAENTPIENTASIYFDFNPPIVTNTTQNIMVSELPTTSVQSVLSENLKVFPNPTKDWVHIQYEKPEMIDYELKDMMGRPIVRGTFQSQTHFSIQTLPDGVYWLHLNTTEGNITHKIIHLN
ncbi:MAG: T9SS type A sorting domain-containing protein [Bacteroidota bacterium]